VNFLARLLMPVLSLFGCQHMAGFELRLRYAYQESLGVEERSKNAAEQGAITPETADHVLELNAELRAMLESAEKAHAEGNAPVADARLNLSNKLLEDLKRFVTEKLPEDE